MARRSNGQTQRAVTEPARSVGPEAFEADALAMEHEVFMLHERIAELEFAREDTGWERLDESGTDLDLSREALRRIIRDSQTMYLKNPLIDHAVGVVSYYVFGPGVNISGRGSANDHVQRFLDDPGNRRVFSGQQAMISNDAQLTYEGNVFLALFSPPGKVTRVRRIPTLQVVAGDIIRNPEDDAEVWFYRRRWREEARDRTGRLTPAERVDYYPDVAHRPSARPKSWGDGSEEGEVHWDSPVVHVRDGGLNGARFGVPTTYSSLDWARAVSRDLSDYATIRRALARFAWKIIAKNRSTAAAARTKLATTVTVDNARETNPPPIAGSTFIGVEGNDIQPLRTAGAAPSPEEGRRLWLMVAAGTGIPETILSGNADAGNLATAKTLDRPTELMMRARQGIWADAFRTIVGYDLQRGHKDGLVPMFEADGEPVDLVPIIDFPDVLEGDVTARVEAVVKAATLGSSVRAGTLPDDLLARLLLTALGVDDVDAIVADMFPADMEAPVDDTLPTEAVFREALDAFSERIVSRTPRTVRRGRATPPATPTPAG